MTDELVHRDEPTVVIKVVLGWNSQCSFFFFFCPGEREETPVHPYFSSFRVPVRTRFVSSTFVGIPGSLFWGHTSQIPSSLSPERG